MKKLMNFLMLSCKKAADLIEKKLSFRLNIKEKIQLSMHTRMCDACKNYQKKSEDMDHLLHDHFQSHPDSSKDTSKGLSQDIKDDIIKKLIDK